MVVLTEISQESSSSSFRYDYDVFLSFRGTDTRYSFTDHLHKALTDATIDTFLDDAEIQTGEDLKPELESAIKSSRASIIVLSKDYASSTWCLDELVLILEQRKSFNQIVIPVFYNVQPTDIRKQQSTFGDAMAKHKQRMEGEINVEKKSQWARKIKIWEKALKEVADIKGEEANGRRETVLIEGIVKEMSSRLHLHKRTEIPKLIGMDSSVQIITSFLKGGSSHTTQILTILGMAGIGKTYLADYVFKLHYHDFERSCFLEDIERRCTLPNGLLDLQKQLLKDVRDGSWMDIHNTNVGTFKIEKLLLRKRTLLVLDGINKFEQLDVLIGTKGLHPQSKIIITSKNELLTEKCRLFETEVPPKHMKHLLQGLNDEESLQLLSWHAFGRKEPKEDYKKESIKVVKYCKGHPLALTVLGSCICSEDATWDDILESLGKDINPKITDVLKISFDSLPYEKDKELFKHVACFFVGEDRKIIEEILKACGVCKSSGIKKLVNRCLVTVGSSNKLMMHQLLQDMGRDIVRQESPNKPWKRSLLWHHEECLDILQNRRGTTKVQGLVLDMKTFEKETHGSSMTDKPKFGFRSLILLDWVHILLSVIWWLFGWVLGIKKGGFETHTFSEMCNLRLLQLNYVILNGSYKNFPKGLRWLCMHGSPLAYIPSELQMENMVALDMSNSSLKQLWKKPTKLRSLKFLNLSSCRELVRLSHFSGLPLLERLILAGCTNLVEVCESIGNYCDRLEVLDMSNCAKLKELPRSIGKLKNLRELSINGCLNLEVPHEIDDSELPQVLDVNKINIDENVSSSAIVEALPRSLKTTLISLPSSLVSLSLADNMLSDKSFPKDFNSLSNLKRLRLDGNLIKSLPDCVRSVRTLEFLSLDRCHRLKTVLCAQNTIKYLNTFNCYSLEKITFYPEKSAPPGVTYYDGYSMSEIQDRFKLQAIAEIEEEILHSLGWINIEYAEYQRLSIADCNGSYDYTGKILPAKMLYEHGVFSTYIKGREIPKWLTHRSIGSPITLESSLKNGKIQGLNLCIVSTVSSTTEVGPSRIEIKNLTKNFSWTYEPLVYIIPEANEEVIVWLSHWMFENNEFEDGDEVSVHVSTKFYDVYEGSHLCYGGEGPDYAHVREYGISLVYDDNGNQKEDPLGYYKSWNHIIGGDLSATEVSSSHYLLKHWRD